MRRSWWPPLLAAWFTFHASPVAAVTLSLPQALALAGRDSPELAAARRAVEVSAALRDQAGAFANPSLAMQVEDTERRETRTSSVLFSQPLELGGKRTARITVAEREQDIAALQLAMRSAALRADVASAFFDALIAQERVQLAEASLALARSGADAAGKRVAAGKVSPVEETRAKLAEAGLRLEVMQARSELRIALDALATTAGGRVGIIDQVDGSADEVPAVPDPEVVRRRVEEAPALRLAAGEVARSTAQIGFERARRIPDVTLTLGAVRDETIGRTQAVVGVSVPLPLFDRNRGNLEAALRREDHARDQASATRMRLAHEAGRAREQLATARDEAETLRSEILPGARSAREAATTGFTLGKFSFLEALDAQRTFLLFRSQHLRALATAHRARAELDRLLGAEP